ncbi:MAG: hypothetical protein ACK5O9_02150 [Holosporales bacterium]|jgi:F-type H+-transporting ATPase subunit b
MSDVHTAAAEAAHHTGWVDAKLVYLVAFILFLVFAGRALKGKLANGIKNYQEEAVHELTEARRLREEAERLQHSSKQRLTNAEAEAADIIARAKAEADSYRAQALADLQRDTEERRQALADKITLTETLIHYEFRQHVVDATIKAAEKALQQRLQAGTVDLAPALAAVQQAVKEDGGLKAFKRAG